MKRIDESLIDKYIQKTRIYIKSLDEGYDSVETNKLAKEHSRISNTIYGTDFFPYIYIYILRSAPDLHNNVLAHLHVGDFEQFKKIYQRRLEILNDFKDKMLLDDWDELQVKKEDFNKEKIEKYNKWKEENPDKHQEIIDEFHKILDDLESNKESI